MTASFSTVRTLDLPGGSLVPFTSSPGERVRILYGQVWLTEEGIVRDAFLASGEEVSLDSRGLAVVEALGPARIQLIEDLRGPSRLAKSVGGLVRRGTALMRRLRLRSARPARGTV